MVDTCQPDKCHLSLILFSNLSVTFLELSQFLIHYDTYTNHIGIINVLWWVWDFESWTNYDLVVIVAEREWNKVYTEWRSENLTYSVIRLGDSEEIEKTYTGKNDQHDEMYVM